MIRFGRTIRLLATVLIKGQVHFCAKAPGVDKSDNGHDDTCDLFSLSFFVFDVFTKNGSMAPAGADHVICTRAFGATILVAVDDG
jgi:hypothetical protein